MNINYPETIINKSSGFTHSESYLYDLCNNTFLSLWSYPNVFRDQGRINSPEKGLIGDGKELCDLLVIFENHIFIFSDKKCEFPKNSNDVKVNWSRWYKKAIRDAAKQIWGAERWLFSYPNTIYLDQKCMEPFPISIPIMENAIIHRIVVAHGVSAECASYFGRNGNGSLMLCSDIVGDMHLYKESQDCKPFTIGQVDPSKGFIHVFDDVTLDIVLKTLDTVSDFATYLMKKEELFLSGKHIMVSGEEDLLACYLTNKDSAGEYCFFSEKWDIDKFTSLAIAEGCWKEFCTDPRRKMHVDENRISYLWDAIIERFSFHIMNGTSYYMAEPSIQSQAEVFKFLARENRFNRRILSLALIDLLNSTPDDHRATRIIKPRFKGAPYYLFLIVPRDLSLGTYDEYRKFRRELLGHNLPVVKLQFPDALDIIGLATETGFNVNHSEDITYLDAHNWTSEDNERAMEYKKVLIEEGLLTTRQFSHITYSEYPKVKRMKGSDRNNPCPCGSGKKYKNCCGKITN